MWVCHVSLKDSVCIPQMTRGTNSLDQNSRNPTSDAPVIQASLLLWGQSLSLSLTHFHCPTFWGADEKAKAMSLASSRYPSLYSSPPWPTTTVQAKQIPLLFSQNTHFLSKNYSFSSTSTTFSDTLLLKPSNSTLKASETESQTSIPAESNESEGEGKEKYEEYEVEIEQSYWLKFAKGRDGATYIDAIAPGGSADKTGKFSVGDKVIATRFYFLSFLLFKIKLLSLRTWTWAWAAIGGYKFALYINNWN